MKAAFRLRGVGMAFEDIAALRDVDLTIEPGEAVGLVGLSGAGKTTLLRLLNGMLRPTSGHVFVDGHDLCELPLSELRRIRSAIGFIHQDLRLVPNLRVLQNVLAGRLGQMSFLSALRMMMIPSARDVREAHRILDRVGIADKLYQRTDRLSGGEGQRAAIARALFQSPRALLADEPISSVDPARARAALSLLMEISRENGLTLCLSLHNVELAREFLPRLVGLRNGRVVFDEETRWLDDSRFSRLYRLGPRESKPAARAIS